MSFVRAIRDEALQEGTPCAVMLKRWPVLLARHEGGVFAVVNVCTHANALLSEGRMRRGAIMCALHGARFDLRTGACAGGAYLALKTFEVQVSGGWIEVEVPEEPPGPQFIPVATRV